MGLYLRHNPNPNLNPFPRSKKSLTNPRLANHVPWLKRCSIGTGHFQAFFCAWLTQSLRQPAKQCHKPIPLDFLAQRLVSRFKSDACKTLEKIAPILSRMAL